MKTITFTPAVDVSFTDIVRGITTLDLQTASTASQESENDRLEQLLTLYMGIRPLFAALTNLRLIPPAWRKAVSIFMESLDALAVLRGFKAGRDL